MSASPRHPPFSPSVLLSASSPLSGLARPRCNQSVWHGLSIRKVVEADTVQTREFHRITNSVKVEGSRGNRKFGHGVISERKKL